MADSVTLPDLVSSGAVTLAVAWKSGRKMQLRRVNMNRDVAAELQETAAQAAEDVRGRQLERWSPEVDSAAEVVHTLPGGDVGSAPELASIIASSHDSLLDALSSAGTLPLLQAGALPAADLFFYAIVIGDDVNRRTVYIRRANARRGLRSSRRLLATLGQVLTRIDEPIFGFDDAVDLIFADDQLLVISQSAFASLFRSNDALLAQVPGWINAITQHLPIEAESEAVLSAACASDTRLRKRLEAISARGHLSDVSADDVRAEMSRFALDADAFFDEHENLNFTLDQVPDVLKILNEDLFAGGLSHTVFRVDRKSAN